MQCSKNKKGFTLIELIVVIAILGIILTILVPQAVRYVARARIATDQDAVRTLNSVTSLYRISVPSPDPFEDDTKSNQELLELLVEGEYFDSVPKPQTKGVAFEWLLEDEKWYLLFDEDSFYIITLLDGLSMDISGYFNGRLTGSYSGSSKYIVIPSVLEGTVITRIWQDAFTGKGLLAINFEEDSEIVQIHARAFYNNNLSQIDFPDTLERIDLWSFKNNNLTEINLPSSLLTIEQEAFNENDLNKITIGSNVNSIGEKSFGENTEQFKQAYETGGAGTYIYSEGSWVKQ